MLIQGYKQRVEVILASFRFTLKCFSVFYIVTLLVWEFEAVRATLCHPVKAAYSVICFLSVLQNVSANTEKNVLIQYFKLKFFFRFVELKKISKTD